ncbi:MAG: DUF45 domain-containing protein [Bacilli bacterium]|nr:DUF45 domain-containing protein [Bacilli bacterium]
MQIEIDGIVYDVIVEKKHIKNTYLRVKEDLNIYVTTSYLTPNYLIKKFVNENVSFIRKQVNKMEKRLEKKLDYYYLGEIINVVIIDTMKRSTFENNTLYVAHKSDIEKWYKKQMKEVFKEHLDTIYDRFTEDVPYPSLTIRKMSTRWGVCNKKLKKVTLNSELIYKKPEYLDYVIVHELSHFIHFDHGKGFWQLVSENDPEYKRHRKELQE